VALLQQARALLCPIQWEEPFGLIAIEAMLTGTPVIGFARGAFPEIIDDGVTGVLVSDVQEMTRAIAVASHLDREACAERARERFSAERMAAEYEHVFESIVRRRSSPALVAEPMAAGESRLIG
jgi:glycosyltransferase involved in cell wall biosynthesis